MLFRRLLHRRQQDTDPRFIAKSQYKDPRVVVPALAVVLAAVIGAAGVVIGVMIGKDEPSSKRASVSLDSFPQETIDGQVFSLQGSGWGGDNSVWVTVDGKYGREASVNPDGLFGTRITVNPLAAGRHSFLVKGQQSGNILPGIGFHHVMF